MAQHSIINKLMFIEWNFKQCENWISIIPSLKHKHFVGSQIIQVYEFSFFHYQWMFFIQTPAYVSIKKSPSCVVRIGIGINKFVMNPMISRPTINVFLKVQQLVSITFTNSLNFKNFWFYSLGRPLFEKTPKLISMATLV